MEEKILLRIRKLIYVFLPIVGGGWMGTACSDFLEVDVKGKATIPTFLSDPQGLYAGLVGTYNKMYLYVDNEFTKYGDVAGNMVSMPMAASSGDMVAQYNFTSDESQITGAVGYIWRKIYVAQANANNTVTVKLGTAGMSVDMMGTPSGDGFALTADLYSPDGFLHEGTYMPAAGDPVGDGQYAPGYEYDLSEWGMGIMHWGPCWWANGNATHITSGPITVV